jgi:protein TonB
MAAVIVYWPNQHELLVSTPLQGGPLNITIKNKSLNNDSPDGPKTAKQQKHRKTERPTTHQASSPQVVRREHSDTIRPEVDHLSTKNNSVAIATSTRSDAKAQTGKNKSAADNQVQKTARLNNNMIDYLSSEFKVRFKYPVLARKRGWQGEVLLNLDINRHGKIARVAIQRSSGYLILDHNAVKTFELIGEISPILAQQLFGDHHLSIPVVYQLTGS